jgi:hypothetical protein
MYAMHHPAWLDKMRNSKLTTLPSADPAVANNMLNFLAQRFVLSWNGLKVRALPLHPYCHAPLLLF